jgi:hypothetical protein
MEMVARPRRWPDVQLSLEAKFYAPASQSTRKELTTIRNG